MNRRSFIRNVLGTTAASVLAGTRWSNAAASKQKHPNILYILTDQWTAFATGYMGDPNVNTPNIDKLASESINFKNAVSVCPVCTPHRASLMTGRYPTSTGMFMNDLYLPDEELCMGEIFRQAGYETGYIGKWHLDGHGRSSYIPPERRQGFDYWKAFECDHNYNNSHYYINNSPQKKNWKGYAPFAQTKDACRYIQDHANRNKPFLFVVSYATPHFPHNTAPQEYKDMYPPEKLKLRANVPEKKQSKVRAEAQGYYGHCTALDDCVGDLLQTLKTVGIAENTIVVFTSDHGEMMGSQGVRPCRKQRVWDESIRVPFLLRCASIHDGGRPVKTPINTPDILPTMLSLCGADVPSTIEGEDLSDLVRKPGAEQDRAVLVMSVSPFADYVKGEEYRGIRTDRYTYAVSVDGPWLMFDNQNDPYQMNNLVGKPEFAGLQKELHGKLEVELAKRNDKMRPRKYYLEKYGYELSGGGVIGYGAESKHQGPSL